MKSKSAKKYDFVRSSFCDLSPSFLGWSRRTTKRWPAGIRNRYQKDQLWKNRYSLEDFRQLLKKISKSKASIICADLNFAETNSSSNEEENSILEIFEEALFRQIIAFPTYSQNILDVAFYRNCFVFSEKGLRFRILYDCTNHEAVHTMLECPVTESKLALQKFRSFGNADYEGINNFLAVSPFQPICHKNITKMCEELYQYLDQMIDIYVPRRTRHRQCVAPWVTSHTSNLLKQLKTQTLLKRYPISYRKQPAQKLETLVFNSSEQDRKEYQEMLLRTRNTDAIFRHLKCLNKLLNLPKIMTSCNISSTNLNEQFDLLNELFQSISSPKQKFSITDITNEDPILTNFDISKQTIQQVVDQIDSTKSQMTFLQRSSRRPPEKSANFLTNSSKTSKDYEKFRIVGRRLQLRQFKKGID